MLDLLPLTLLGGSFSIVSSNKGVHQYLIKYLKVALCRSPKFSPFSSLLLVLCPLNANCPVLPGFSARLFSSAPPGSSSPYHGLEILSRWEAENHWSHLFVPQLSGITVLHRLMFSVSVLAFYSRGSVSLSTKKE